MKAAPLSKKKEKSLCLLIVSILIDFIYFFSLKTKTNPSPKGNGFAFNLFGDPNGIRTHDTTVKGWCLNRLTMGPLVQALYGGLSPPAFPL